MLSFCGCYLKTGWFRFYISFDPAVKEVGLALGSQWWEGLVSGDQRKRRAKIK